MPTLAYQSLGAGKNVFFILVESQCLKQAWIFMFCIFKKMCQMYSQARFHIFSYFS